MLAVRVRVRVRVRVCVCVCVYVCGPVSERVIRFKCSLQNTVLDVLRARGWLETTGLASTFLHF